MLKFLNPKLLGGAVLLDLLGKFVFPATNFLLLMCIFVFVDFVTGVAKAMILEGWKSVTSLKMRSTISKLTQYAGLVLVITLLANMGIAQNFKTQAELIINAAYALVIAVEFKSIIENVQAIQPDSNLSQMVFTPLLNLLNIKISKSKKAIDAITEQETQETETETKK